MDQKSWFIPRPSLSSSSSSSVKNQNYFYNDEEIKKEEMRGSSVKDSKIEQSNSSRQEEACIDSDNLNCDIKRGSTSSQGSSDSEQSIHVRKYLILILKKINGISLQSTTSLLLTVKNLENFIKVQNFQPTSSTFASIEKNQSTINSKNFHHFAYNINRSKDADQLSVASSTHFTMVNGFGHANSKNNSSFFCKRSKQVSVLIVTMSILFFIGISSAVLLIECNKFLSFFFKKILIIFIIVRNREMPR